jgi:TetR/AcrR family transcriptional regulator
LQSIKQLINLADMSLSERAKATRKRTEPARVGRPAEQDRQAVRARLCHAARELFARQGFEAVSLRQVAAESGVTPAMIHYYFGDKRGLWQAVLEDYLEEALGGMLAARPEIEAEGGLANYLRRHTEILARQPWVAPLIYREIVLGGGPSADFVQRFPARLRELLGGAIEQARQRGELSADLDPELMLISLLSSAVFPFLLRPMIEKLFGIPVDTDFAQRWAEHATRLFYQGARP